ncbi:MAG: hypothetical protein ABSG16_06240 [Candidatus Acidiferrum sp.]|jgi:hypothetical protein
MNIAKRVLMFIGFVVLAAALVSVLAPKATHALVATLVQVANTPANPVPNRDADSPEHATTVVSSCSVTTGPGPGAGVFCVPYPGSPAGKRLVIEQLEANCSAPKGNNVTQPFIAFYVGGVQTSHNFPMISQGDDSTYVYYTANQPVRYYVDPDSQILFSAATTDTTGGTTCSLQVDGYLVIYP